MAVSPRADACPSAFRVLTKSVQPNVYMLFTCVCVRVCFRPQQEMKLRTRSESSRAFLALLRMQCWTTMVGARFKLSFFLPSFVFALVLVTLGFWLFHFPLLADWLSICLSAGIVIKYENMSYKTAVHHAHQVLSLAGKANKYVRDLFEPPDVSEEWQAGQSSSKDIGRNMVQNPTCDRHC